jgi:hypothetical protein
MHDGRAGVRLFSGNSAPPRWRFPVAGLTSTKSALISELPRNRAAPSFESTSSLVNFSTAIRRAMPQSSAPRAGRAPAPTARPRRAASARKGQGCRRSRRHGRYTSARARRRRLRDGTAAPGHGAPRRRLGGDSARSRRDASPPWASRKVSPCQCSTGVPSPSGARHERRPAAVSVSGDQPISLPLPR